MLNSPGIGVRVIYAQAIEQEKNPLSIFSSSIPFLFISLYCPLTLFYLPISPLSNTCFQASHDPC
jgi:hypothetical protein